jgi:AraC-like DNA-binding protein
MLERYPHVVVTRAGITRVPPDWAWDTVNASWQDSDIWIILRGRGLLKSPHGEFELRPGDCYWYRAGERYIARNAEGQRVTVFYCHFDLQDAARKIVRPPAEKLPSFHRRMTDMEAVAPILQRIAALHHEQPRRAEEVNAWGGALIAEIASQDRQSSYSGLELEQHQAVEALCADIRAVPGKYTAVRDMAEHMGYTPQHFARVFRKFKATSPKSFLIRTRIERAKIYLTASYSIGRIAELLGYSDVYFFSKQFKTCTGMSPSEWRKSQL